MLGLKLSNSHFCKLCLSISFHRLNSSLDFLSFKHTPHTCAPHFQYMRFFPTSIDHWTANACTAGNVVQRDRCSFATRNTALMAAASDETLTGTYTTFITKHIFKIAKSIYSFNWCTIFQQQFVHFLWRSPFKSCFVLLTLIRLITTVALQSSATQIHPLLSSNATYLVKHLVLVYNERVRVPFRPNFFLWLCYSRQWSKNVCRWASGGSTAKRKASLIFKI